jgi:hypothetical protein
MLASAEHSRLLVCHYILANEAKDTCFGSGSLTVPSAQAGGCTYCIIVGVLCFVRPCQCICFDALLTLLLALFCSADPSAVAATAVDCCLVLYLFVTVSHVGGLGDVVISLVKTHQASAYHWSQRF